MSVCSYIPSEPKPKYLPITFSPLVSFLIMATQKPRSCRGYRSRRSDDKMVIEQQSECKAHACTPRVEFTGNNQHSADLMRTPVPIRSFFLWNGGQMLCITRRVASVCESGTFRACFSVLVIMTFRYLRMWHEELKYGSEWGGAIASGEIYLVKV